MRALAQFKFAWLAFVVAIAMIGCSTTGSGKADTPQGLFDRHIAATYGSGGLDAYQSISSTGKIVIAAFGATAPIVLNQMVPDSTSLTVEIPGALVRNGCHAGKCWDQQPGQGLATLSGDRLQAALQQADYDQFAHMADYYPSMEIAPAADGGASDADTVRATRANGDADIFHFSKESGLLVSSTIISETPQGKAAITANYSDFQEHGGILLPMKVEQVTPLVTLQIELDKVTFDGLSAADFSI